MPWKSAAISGRLCLWLLPGALSGLLILDPVDVQGAAVSYSTYFGGSQYEGAYAVAVDTAGNAFVAGSTDSTNDFPLLNPFQPEYGGGDADAFLAKFDPDGRLLFSTFFGGAGYDAFNDLALDPDGNVVLVGETRSVDLPSTEDAFQFDYAGGSAFGYGDGFLARFSPDGARLLYCSYFGGSGDERIWGLAVDADGNVCLAGPTDSRNFPLRNPLQATYGGGDSDGFIAKFDSALSSLVFSTYFGGEDRDEDPQVAVDPAGLIYVAGQTLSTNFPVTLGAFQTKHVQIPERPVNWDGFVAKLSADGATLIYSTYVGDATGDDVYGVAADASGSAYVTGSISASWDPGTFPLGFQPEPGYGGADAWVAKLKPDGSNFEWFTYLGGFGGDYAFDLALDHDNNVYVTGVAFSSDFPTEDAPQTRFGGGGQDAFVSKISADGSRLIYSTYLGGGGEEWGYRLAVDPQGNVVAVGQTAALNFPVVNAFQTTNASLQNILNPADAYITRITPAPQLPSLKSARSGLNLVLTWPANFVGYGLESSVRLGPDAEWTPVSPSPVVVGNQFTVIQRPSADARCYRLRQP